MDNEENKIEGSKRKKWLTWVGIGAFIFFLAKGILWLSLPALLLWWGTTH